MTQVVQILGALMILAAYFGLQSGKLGPDRLGYQVLNFAGAAALGVIALLERQWGFVLLEVVWAVVTVPHLLRLVSAR